MNDIETLSEKLDELIFWIKFSEWPTFRSLLIDILREDIDKLVYELSDGKRSTRDIASIIARGRRSITHSTVANMWKRWLVLNLVMPTERKGRCKRAASLESIGIEVPQLESSSGEGSDRNG